jgi:hypothetical protein
MSPSTPTPSPAPACRPNFSGAGRRRRRSISIGLTLFGVALLAALILSGAPAWGRAVVALPFAFAAMVGLQVTRNTCVAHAAAGTFEHEDFSTSRVEVEQAAASRRVARTIYRDAVLAGLAAGALGYATAWLG